MTWGEDDLKTMGKGLMLDQTWEQDDLGLMEDNLDGR